MNQHEWYGILIRAWLILSLGLTGGCMLLPSPGEPATTPAAPANSSKIYTFPPEPGTATGPTKATSTTEAASADDALVGNDPVSGRNQEVALTWEELCLSSDYQVQIAKDSDFTIIVLDTGTFAPASAMTPAAYYPAGGRAGRPSSAIAAGSILESGHTYYWRARVRRAATGQYILSPWSEAKSFTVKSGLPANTTSSGLQAVYPKAACSGCQVKLVSFSWSPLKDTTKYKFVLAKDAAMTQVVKEAVVTTTAYQYDGTLDYSSSYFWRVMALEPAPSDWSATFSFQTELAPSPPPPPVKTAAPATPLWAWVVIAVGTALVVATLILILWMSTTKTALCQMLWK